MNNKKYIYVLLLPLYLSCNPLYKKYQTIDIEALKSNLYNEQHKIIKDILSKESKSSILIIRWKKNMLVKDAPLYYSALLYTSLDGKIKLLSNYKKNKEKEILITKDSSNEYFREFSYILNNYLQGKDEHLLSLRDSFSSSEMNSPYYIYDFVKHKKFKINSFIFDKEGKIIQ
ncbi:hypothetical protein OZ664_18750 [Elizabethkingia sp. HX WHF]|uniref:hypothetical protein n=1 Tax=Elizabethkingia TaxID=308865 RepID=UPI000998FA5F|nr:MULTISPECIES: hypothetical protein [Elizabethkingia]ATL43610.1 hypothetical protein CQS02_10040 [Elizabethkingia miricola]MCL1637905.1 hypothetical protein [Elizabethkingia bruuniana]MDX8566053.1 hypothetical protein [Elizabethkingia sp. HX WHF]OPC17819.1 hypothetical protein BAY00_14455 [Elizabethkingia bruuniana]